MTAAKAALQFLSSTAVQRRAFVKRQNKQKYFSQFISEDQMKKIKQEDT